MPIPTDRSRRRTTRAEVRRLHRWLAGLALLLLAACSGEAPLPGDPLRLVSASLPDAVRGEPYQQDLAPTGGLRPYTFTLEDGRLPPGLALQGGTLIGTPTALGRFEFTVSVSDANLSSTFEDYVLTVRELPVPALDLALPNTEVRGEVVLRGRVTDARDLRALRLWVEWQDAAVRLGEGGVRSSRNDVVVFVDEHAGGVAIELAVLGEPLDGDVELFTLELTTVDPVVLGVDVRSEFLYSGRHAFAASRLGSPAAATGPAVDPAQGPSGHAGVDEPDPPDADGGAGDGPVDPAQDAAPDEAPEDEAPEDEAPDEEAPDDGVPDDAPDPQEETP